MIASMMPATSNNDSPAIIPHRRELCVARASSNQMPKWESKAKMETLWKECNEKSALGEFYMILAHSMNMLTLLRRKQYRYHSHGD